AVHTTKDLNELFNTIRQDLSIILNTENFFIALYDRKSDTFTLPYIEDEKDTFDIFPAGKTLTAYVVKHDKPLLVTDEDMHRLTQSGVVETIGASSKIWLGVPLKAGKEIIGTLVVQSYTDETAYDEKDLQILKFVSSQIGLSVERKRAQEALREERDKAQTYLDVAGAIFVAIDTDQKVSLVNKKGCEILGYKEEKIIGKNWFDNFLPEAVRDEVKSVFTKLMAGEVEPVEYFENPVLTKSGEKRIITWHNAILKDEMGTILGVLSSGEDITEHKQAEEALRKSEEQLRQSQKMEAVGRLAGGVAHDLNNLLTGVTGYSDLLSVRIGEDGPQRRYVTEIQKATSRAVSLIRQLLAFSRKQMLQPKIMNLNDTVADMEKMLRRVIGEDIELVTVLDPALGAAKADPGQMGQIIMNLVVNARDAMPQGGKLTIATANVDLDEEYVRQHTGAQPGSCVMLTVSDTGDGMDEQTCSHIFEPFFTT
ncbi:PAS domain S-box protein, partial [bacterium]|nr:PAS domain S-box protein [bacterium]